MALFFKRKVWYNQGMDEEFVFKASAFKHGIVEPDIRHAFEVRLYDHILPGDEDKNLLLGVDRNGNLLEIVYNVLESDVINVFHAMPCRKAYRDFFNL
jgi:hypothetical protein